MAHMHMRQGAAERIVTVSRSRSESGERETPGGNARRRAFAV